MTRKLFILTIAIVLLVALSGSALAEVGDLGHAWVLPASVQLTQGEQTTVKIQARSQEEATLVGVTLNFNPAILSADNVNFLSGLNDLNQNPLTIDNNNGQIQFGAAKGVLEVFNTADQTVDIAEITFIGQGSGISTLSLSVVGMNGVTTSDNGQIDIQVAPQCIDNDGDEYGFKCSLGADCDDNNPDINPGVEESCNEVDDDCDEQVDEGFDLDTDPNNCGSCGIACDNNQECLNGDCGVIQQPQQQNLCEHGQDSSDCDCNSPMVDDNGVCRNVDATTTSISNILKNSNLSVMQKISQIAAALRDYFS